MVLKYLLYKNKAIRGLGRTLYVSGVCQLEGFAFGGTVKVPAMTTGQP